MSTNKFDPSVLVPGILSAIKGASVTRRILGQSLKKLGEEIAEGKHIPDEALKRAHQDQKLLDKLFKKGS